MDTIKDNNYSERVSKVRAEGEISPTNSRPRKLEPLPNRPPIHLEPLPSPLKPPSPLLQLQGSDDMNRQTSTTPLVEGKDSNGLNDSCTSMDMAANMPLPRHKLVPISLVRKNSQVQPIVEKDQEANISPCSTPVKDNEIKSRNSSCAAAAGKIITSLLIGIYFGWFLQKSTVYKPESIRNQFLFKEFIMLKTFLGALLSSQFCILLMSYLPLTRSYVEAARQAYSTTLCSKGIISTLAGAFILGAGMAIGAACPGMVLAQNGSLVPNSAYTILGGFLGCLIYGFLHKFLIKITTPSQPYKTQFLYEKIKAPFIALAIPCMAFCMGALVLMELLKPENQRLLTLKDIADQILRPSNGSNFALSTCEGNSNWFTQEMWSPSVCGTLIGLVQIPIILVLTDTMGSSSGYLTLTSQWVVTKRLKETFPYFAKARSGVENFWMVLYILGAALGGALAAASSCTFLKAPGVPWWQAVLGGFLMLFGSRLASGCTSGHGISGAALLVGLSWLAVPVMFCGAICTAFAMEYSGTNNFVYEWEP